MPIVYLPIRRWFLLAAALLSWALPAAAGSNWLIATGDETAQAGAPLLLEVVKPAVPADWPDTLTLRLTQGGAPQEVDLRLTVATATDNTRRTYHGMVPQGFAGLVRAELVAPAGSGSSVTSNRLALVVADPSAAPPSVASASTLLAQAPAEAAAPMGSTLPVSVADDFVFSPHEPMYFVVGNRGGNNARFQLSFKYQIFDPQSYPARLLPPLSGIYFGYTQTSSWDLAGNSQPFRDTSYRPSFFWQMEPGGAGLKPLQLRMGYEHESNGKDGIASRSIDMLFVRPIWRKEFANGSAFAFIPKIYGYLDKGDNPDIQRYRGYVDWGFRYGYEDGWLLTSQLRRGTANHGSAQFDLSVPFRTPVFTRMGGFLNFQIFSGYGETLLDYNVKSDTQFRIGVSLVR
jgi:outer membrane phospholipase A